MTIPLWVSVLVAVIAGIFGGVVSPLFSDALHKKRWQQQRSFELKYEAFQGAIDALAAWAADAMDFELQAKKVEHNGTVRVTEIRPQTFQSLEHYENLIEALFTESVKTKYCETLKCKIAIDNVPNTEFEEKRIAFIKAGSDELGLRK